LKQRQIRLKLILVTFALLVCSFSSQPKLAFGETEISLDDAVPTPTPVAKAASQSNDKKAIATPTNEIIMDTPATSTPTEETLVEEPTPTPAVVQGHMKAKYVYEAGIKAFKRKEYDQAIRALKKFLAMPRDRYTQKFYYAEANATLGVIYQYHIIHLGRAYRYYAAALKIDPHTKTAKKHIHQVYKYRHRKD
jgi:tetratricopeptide (TPR) repeat protein